MEAFIVAGSDRIAGGTDIAVMHQKMLGAEMRIQHHRHQDVAQPSFGPVLLMHEFVGIDDAHGAGNDPDAKEQADFGGDGQVFGLGGVPDQAEDRDKLDEGPDHGDQAIPVKIFLGCLQVRVFQVEPDDSVQRGKQIPCCGRHQQHPPGAKPRHDPDQRDQQERQPEWQGAGQLGNL